MPDVLVLCYHAVARDWPSELAVRPEDLERQVARLLERGYVPATFSQAISDPPAEKVLAVTFDDSYRSVTRLGRPVLDSLGVPATVFVPTGPVGSERPMAWAGIDGWLGSEWEPELVPMGWDELEELAGSGWEIGSHSVTHPYLTQVADDVLAEELAGSRATLVERLGRCDSIAYPYGDVDARVVAAARQAGYRTGAALPDRYRADPQLLEWPRLMIGRDDSEAAVERRTSRSFRRLQASRAWSLVPLAVGAAKRLRPRDDSDVHPGLRLVAREGGVARGRWRKLARLRSMSGAAHGVWPRLDMPVFVLPVGDRAVSRWMQETFEPSARVVARRAPATWHLLRARGLVRGDAPGTALAAAEQALGRELPGARVAGYSPSGTTLTKVTCFVFEAGATEPSIVVKGMATRSYQWRLEAELTALGSIREAVAGDPEVAGALPAPPIWQGTIDGDLLMAEALDPLARHTGAASDEEALLWLERFHAASSHGRPRWGEADTAAAVGALRHAWSFGRPRSSEAMIAAVTGLLSPLAGSEVERCAVHGDFWRGNLAGSDGEIRVYDFEWARLDGHPFLDVWTYELADLRDIALDVEAEDLTERIEAAIGRVEQVLARRGTDPRFARAMLAPSHAELSFRFRALTGYPGGNEPGAKVVMAALERILL